MATTLLRLRVESARAKQAKTVLASGVDAESSAEQLNALQHRITRMEQSLETVVVFQRAILEQVASILERLPQP